MLKKLSFIPTCLIIIQCSNGKPSETGELTSTTISIHERVNQQVSPLLKLLDDFENAPNEKERYLLKGKLEGKLEGSFKQMIEEREKADRLLEEKGQLLEEKWQLKNKMEFFSKSLGILSVHSRFETLVDDLYPERRPFHIGIAKAFEEILTSTLPKFADRPCIKIFRQRVKSYGISAESFVDTVRLIYGIFSDKAAHKMSAFEPKPPLYNDTEGIKELLMDFGITADDAKVCAIQIVLQPLPMSK